MPAVELSAALKQLRLPAFRDHYLDHAEEARRERLSYEEYLQSLVDRELEHRRAGRVERFLRESRLPLEKTLATFERSRLPVKVDAMVSTLLDGSFLDRNENVLAFGNPGSGKTHLLCAIGQELVIADHRILYRSSELLVQELLLAKKELRLERLLRKFRRYDALVLDDIGYVQQSRDEMEVLFTLFADRYERGSLMITSNLPFSKWQQIFKDPMTTAAAIDRLVHHSVILELNLPSYRLQHAKQKNSKEAR
jgi:DNA replication protein DnaC